SPVLAAASPAVTTLPAVSTTPPVPTYKVVGVASNDVLKIRSGPDATADIVKAIPFDGKGIRMVGSCSGQWCPVGYLDAKGWVNRRDPASETGSRCLECVPAAAHAAGSPKDATLYPALPVESLEEFVSSEAWKTRF